ncbi:MAG TPA: isoleucine--tRNA ligase [Candidatus Limnocylindria bacterium]|nr:isoleucine--tRNA ligase [Candidatus Limnocylindria bacterium]
MDYKNTLNLPRTDFAMKADLVTREPQRLQKWEKENLYARIQAARTGAEKFVLHDGPPFANGDVHIGTALNKILKDIVVKYKTLRGFSAPYVPGWDCHGLPIEFKVSQEMRKAGNTSADAVSIRQACDAYARKYIDLQRTQFKRLGVLGDWENPYLTLNKEYEADELRLFADIVEKGFVYRGKKPVYWSIPARTALAEAEVEYHDHTSTSVFVKFPVVGEPNTFIVIWTTTPWTLPANLAVAYNSTFSYSQVLVNDEAYIVSTMLLPGVAEKCGWGGYQIMRSLDGSQLAALEYKHPFCNRTGKLHAGDNFVENSTGTGFVHIAPGHGLDDYNLGRQVGLPIYSPVDDDGKLATNNDLPLDQQFGPELIGKSILEKGDGKSEANEAVLAILRANNRIAHAEPYSHSYPFCWRSKTPVIFRAMDQWFIRIDHAVSLWSDELNANTNLPGEPQGGPHSAVILAMMAKLLLRKDDGGDYEGTLRWKALDCIQTQVSWVPDWGLNRIKSAVETRPDWCISRQRTWGVPIPAFYDAQGNAILNADIVRNAAALIQQHGSNVWFEKSAAELWSLVKPKNWSGAEAVAKSQDTLDVWIDSGSSSRAVIARRPEIRGKEKPFQADLYLEGSDQHRGWFQSSLLLSLAGNGAAPYKTVLTHGFMVDEDREKISKSKQGQGVYHKPQTAEAYIKDYGADVIRLWVASQDYRNDIVVSEERLKKVSETYRGIRNALRYQLSNLYDFHPSHHAIADKDLTGLDRWILNEFAKLERDVLEAYDKYEFHVVYQRVSQFVAVELSSQYHDLVKDRLYTDPANSPRRRSTQTALCYLVTGLARLLAPVLAFTADEAWEFVPGTEQESVHEEAIMPSRFALSAEDERDWKELFAARPAVLLELEKARQSKLIGKSLDAKVTLQAHTEGTLDFFRLHREELRELLNVSQLEIVTTAPLKSGTEAWIATVAKADGMKCERCWHWETDVGQDPAHSTICARCVEAVKQVAPVA